MNDPSLEEKVNRLDKDAGKTTLETDRCIFELRLEISRLHLELTALKEYMKVASPSFAEQFPHILEKACRDIPPGTH